MQGHIITFKRRMNERREWEKGRGELLPHINVLMAVAIPAKLHMGKSG